jgi:hypothetical protein
MNATDCNPRIRKSLANFNWRNLRCLFNAREIFLSFKTEIEGQEREGPRETQDLGGS